MLQIDNLTRVDFQILAIRQQWSHAMGSCSLIAPLRVRRRYCEGYADQAAQLMLVHLDHIKDALNLDVADEEVELESIFER